MSINGITASSPDFTGRVGVPGGYGPSSPVGRSSAANDRVALSIATNLVNQSSIISPAQRSRILQLQSAIEAHQFQTHPLELSIALVKAHLWDS
jgi:hypothetical protein